MQRLAALALILAHSTVYAEPYEGLEPKKKWQYTFNDFTDTVKGLRDAEDSGGYPFDRCRELVKRAAAEGVQPDMKMVRWNDEVLKFSDIDKLCDAYEHAFHIGEVAPLFVQAQRSLDMMTKHLDLSQTDPSNQASFEQSAKKCFATADKADQLGIGAETFRFRNGDKMRFDEARAKICEPLAKAAASFGADVKKATDERIAEAAAPYKEVGIKGDKLQFCIENANHNIYGVGGSSLEPAQIKKASVLFTLWTDSATGGYSLQRHVFKGDKFVSYSERKFPLVPAPRAYK